MPRLERRVDKHGFPIPPQIDDLPGRNAPRDTEQFGNMSFGARGKRELSESGQRWKKRIIWLGIISIVGGLLFSSFAKPFWEMYAGMRTQMGKRSFYEGDFVTARIHFDAALSANPNQLTARAYRGKSLYFLQELDLACEDLTAIITESNDDDAKRSALDTRSMIYFRQNRAAAAMRDADDAVQLDVNSITARNSRAYLCALLGQDLKKGMTDINLALAREPNDAAFLDTRGYLHFKQGNYDEALADLDRAVKTTEANYTVYLMEQERPHPGRGLGLTREVFQRLLQQVRENLGVMYYHRGEVYEALKRPEDAALEKNRGKEHGYNPAEGVF